MFDCAMCIPSVAFCSAREVRVQNRSQDGENVFTGSSRCRAGPILLNGYVVFDTPILGVLIGNALGTTDALLGRPGVAYNQNSFRGLELEAATSESDSFEISADRLRIDFVMEIGDWTDDIRIVTAVPAPPVAALLALGGLARRRRR
jgi:MYXO-CTERM domain-containing protein